MGSSSGLESCHDKLTQTVDMGGRVVSSTLLVYADIAVVGQCPAVSHLLATTIHAATRRAWGLTTTTSSKGEEEESLALEHVPILVWDLFHGKSLLGHLDKTHVGPSALLEAEIDHGLLVERKQVLECLHQQRKRRFEVDALGRDDDIWFLFHHLLRERLTPASSPDVKRRPLDWGAGETEREGGDAPVQHQRLCSVLEVVQSDVVLHQVEHLELVSQQKATLDSAFQSHPEPDQTASGAQLQAAQRVSTQEQDVVSQPLRWGRKL